MKTVGIVTIESMNFGNRLQNYAMQETLRSMGVLVESFRRKPQIPGLKHRFKSIIQLVLQTKAAKFKQFDSNIKFSQDIVTRDGYPADIDSKYDYFVAGSDQVWNPYYDFVAGQSDFLTFAAPSKRIAYAPSFGVSSIPENRRDEYAQWLSEFAHLSVREEAGAQIIKELTGRIAPVVLDPTLMLSATEWEKVMRPSKYIPNGEYVLVYSLGEKNDDFKTAIDYYGAFL